MDRIAARAAAFKHALDALSRRSRSARELARWLAQRDHASEDIDATIERLTAQGALNDAEYARSFVRSRALGRGMSRRRVHAELARRGVARDVVEAAISEVLADEDLDEAVLINAAATKKMRLLGTLAPDVRRKRLYSFLARRGFPPDLVRTTVAKFTRPEE